MAESYTLTVSAEGLCITYSDLEAAYRACGTLKQILAQSVREISCLYIEDSPAIKIPMFWDDVVIK